MKTIMREKQWTEKYPELDTGPVPNESCVSPDTSVWKADNCSRRVLRGGSTCRLRKRKIYSGQAGEGHPRNGQR